MSAASLSWWTVAFARLGAWRGEFVWRLLGLAIWQLWVQNLGEEAIATYWDNMPVSFHAFSWGGLLLLAVGPRLALLAAIAACGLAFVGGVTTGASTVTFIADEYLVQVGVPCLGVVAALMSAVRARRSVAPRRVWADEVDRAHVWIFRAVLITTLFFAAFHKLNDDFLDPATSCAALGNRLGDWWPSAIGRRLADASPAAVVLGEAILPFVLLVHPRLGFALTTLVIATMAHIGPTAFALTIVALGGSCLQAGDLVPIRRSASWVLGPLLAFALAFSLWSFSVYSGPTTWIRFFFFQLAWMGALALAGVVLLARGRQAVRRIRSCGIAALRRAVVPSCFRRRGSFRPPLPAAASWVLLALVVNGLTPYLGVKHRYSTAMLSNLRVDEDRWNHWLVPRWVYLRDHDPYVHVDVVDPPPPRLESRRTRLLEPGLFTPSEFEHRWRMSSQRGHDPWVEFRYAGEVQVVDRVSAHPDVLVWAESLPARRLFQASLSAGPQRCVH